MDASNRSATARDRFTASIRLLTICPATYRAPAPVLASSSASPVSGRATPASTTIKATTNTSSTRVRPESALLLGRAMVGPVAAHGDERLQLQEALFADAPDVHQFFDLLEASVLLAVLDDPLCRRFADAGQRIELRDGRGVQIDGRGERGHGLGGLGFLRLRRGGGLRSRERREAEDEQDDQRQLAH